MLKKNLTEEEKFGLTAEEITLATRYLRRHKTKGALSDADAMLLYEHYMIGTSFKDLALQFPQFPIAQIILSAALRKWARDRDRMMSSLRDRVRAKVVKSVVESVDFLTMMISVTNAEHLETMRQYVLDPSKNKKPDLRIESIKEYKEILESLQKMVDGTTNPKQKSSALYGALEDTKKIGDKNKPKEIEEDDPAKMLAEVIDVDGSTLE